MPARVDAELRVARIADTLGRDPLAAIRIVPNGGAS